MAGSSSTGVRSVRSSSAGFSSFGADITESDDAYWDDERRRAWIREAEDGGKDEEEEEEELDEAGAEDAFIAGESLVCYMYPNGHES